MRACLIVTYAYPPSSSPGAVRMARLVERLEALGWTPHILTVGRAAMVRSQGLPDPLDAQAGRVIRIDDPLAGAAQSVAAASSVEPSKSNMLKGLAKTLLFPDRTLPWALKLPSTIDRLRPIAPAVILSTSPSLSTHVAARRLSKKLGARWVAEFRDPVSWLPERDETSSLRRGLLARLERWVVARADITVTISEAFSEYFRDQYPQARIRTVANGTDFRPDAIRAKLSERADRLAAKGPRDPLVLVHAGALYGGAREPGPLIEAAQRAAQQVERPIRLRFIGGDSHLAAEAASRLGASDMVEAVGALDHSATVAETESADAVVALLHRDPVARIGIMSKFFDYAATGNPVLVVGERQAMLSRIVEEEGAGAAREYDDIEGIAQWIAELARNPAGPEYDALELSRRWSADRMAERMAQVFDEVCAPA